MYIFLSSTFSEYIFSILFHVSGHLLNSFCKMITLVSGCMCMCVENLPACFSDYKHLHTVLVLYNVRVHVIQTYVNMTRDYGAMPATNLVSVDLHGNMSQLQMQD